MEIIEGIKAANKKWDEQGVMIRTTVTGGLTLFGLFFTNKLIMVILVILIFGQRVLYGADALEKAKDIVTQKVSAIKEKRDANFIGK